MKYFILTSLVAFSLPSFASSWKSFEGTYQASDSTNCRDHLGIVYSPNFDIEALNLIFTENDDMVGETITEREFLTTAGGSIVAYHVDNQISGHYISMLELNRTNELVKKLTLKVKSSDGHSINSLEYSYSHLPSKTSENCLYIRMR